MADELLSEELIEATYLFCYKRLRNTQDAEDLAQDILLEALRGLRAGRPSVSFHAWYWALARNRFSMFLRLKRYGAVSLELIGGDVAAPDAGRMDDALVSGEETGELNRALSRLSALHRQIVILYYLREMKVADIAKELNIPAGTVKRRLFDAKNEIRKGVETMTNSGKAAFAPAQVTLSGGYMIPNYWNKISDLLTTQIFVCCAKEARTLREIADDIGVAPVYFEDKISYLLERKFLRETSKGKYLADFVVYPAQAWADYWKELSAVYANIGPEITEAIAGCEQEIRALGFYGSDFPFGRLLWILYVDAVDIFSRLMLDINNEKWREKVPENNGKDYRLLALVTYPEERVDYGGPNKSVPWSNLHSHFRTSAYRHLDHANLFQMAPFGDRDQIVTDANADLLMRIYDDPAVSLTPLEEEAAANLIKAGYLEKRGGGLYLTMPVMTHDCQAQILCLLRAAVSGLAKKYAEQVGSLGEKMLLPLTRKDLYEEFAHWVMQQSFFPIGYVLHYGMHGGPLEIPADYAASAAGICLYVTK